MAETLALTKDSDTAIFIACLVDQKNNIFYIKKEVNAEVFTDNHCLYETINTTKSVLNKCFGAKIINLVRDL